MDIGLGIRHEQRTKQTQEQRAATQARIDLVRSASPMEVQRCLQELEQRGCIVQDISAGYEELAIDEELAEEEFDVEWDFSDEDALTLENDERLSEVSETGPFLLAVAYVLRVFRDGDGGVEIDVPEMGCETYIGRDAHGKDILQELSRRRDAYRAIAEWLLGSYAMKQADTPVEFLSIHQPIAQTDFIKKHDLGIPMSSFAKYLVAAQLAWNTGSIPLRRLFKK
ncbi:MAG: hypothetical protein IJH50_14520 [Kiritimatiellae bacterium]|nr:hypothetical protein [Kiritimatiellia bacterium]